MQISRRFSTFICAGFLAAVLGGCGGSDLKENVPSSATIFQAHSVIFRNNSTMTMGYNEFGQLGDGTVTNREEATLVPGLGRMTKAALGGDHTLVFNNTTSVVMAWGYNGFGQIGNASVSTSAGSAYSAEPKPVQFSADVQDIAAGAYHSLAVAGGSVYAWGYNGYGQIGNNTFTNQSVPVRIGADVLGTAVKVAAGGFHSLALGDDGSVYAWGNNSHGQLGYLTYNGISYVPGNSVDNPLGFRSYSSSTVPRKVPLPEMAGEVEEIAAGGKFSLALEVQRDGAGNMTDQRLWGWGFGGVGQLGLDPLEMELMLTEGNPETAYSLQPVQIYAASSADPGALFIKKLTVGSDHILLLLGRLGSDGSDGTWTVRALGYNFYGQLGNNTFANSFTLVQTLNSAGSGPIRNVRDIAAFGNHSLALVNGVWFGWGNNAQGQLGNPPPLSSAANPKLPVRVKGF